MENKQQHYRNHLKMDLVQYALLLPIGILLVVAAVLSWIDYAEGLNSLWSTIVSSAFSICIFAMVVRFRYYALIAQDRAIRAEEQFRHYHLTGQLLPTGLQIKQIVALRFSSDDELPSLAQRAVAEQLTADQIKQSIQNWRADWYRV